MNLGSRHRSGVSVSSAPVHLSFGESPVRQTDGGSSQFLPAAASARSTTYHPAAGAAPKAATDASRQTFSSTSTSSEHVLSASAPSTPLRQSLTRHLNGLEKCESEEMQRWMQRQQESTRASHPPFLHYYPSMGQESWANTGVSDLSQDDSMSTMRVAAMAQPAFQLADAQVIFLPLVNWCLPIWLLNVCACNHQNREPCFLMTCQK